MSRKHIALVLMGLIYSVSDAQYVTQYPYLYWDDLYSTPTIGYTNFTLPRPTETYLSVRIRSLSSGFAGLIRDSFTDQFRNPAIRVNDSPYQAFGDFGSVGDMGKFTVGGFANADNQTFGAAVMMDKLMRRTSTSTSASTPSTPSSGTSSYSNTSEDNPEKIGGRISIAWELAATSGIGIHYEYQHNKDRGSWRSSSSYSSPPNNDDRVFEFGFSGDIHAIGAGGLVQMQGGTLQLMGQCVFSTHSLMNRSTDVEKRPGYLRTFAADYPTEVKTEGVGLGLIYERAPSQQEILRLLVDFAYTSYTATGSPLAQSIDTSGYSTTSFVELGSRNSDGSIVDLRAGIGYERSFGSQVLTYIGISCRYIRNTEDATKTNRTTSTTRGPNPPVVTSTSGSTSTKRQGVDIRTPIGAEFLIGEYVTLRGGMEPRYRSGETSTEELTTTMLPSTSLNRQGNEITQRGLSFATQFGIEAHHDGYGRLGVLFGKNVLELSYWTFFLQYFF